MPLIKEPSNYARFSVCCLNPSVAKPFPAGCKEKLANFWENGASTTSSSPMLPRQKLMYHRCMDIENTLTLLQTCVILPAHTTMSSECLATGIGCYLEEEVSLPSSSEEDEGSGRCHGHIHCFCRRRSRCCCIAIDEVVAVAFRHCHRHR